MRHCPYTLLLPVLLLTAACGDETAQKPPPVTVCSADAECGAARYCDGGLCRPGSRPVPKAEVAAVPASVELGAVQVGGRKAMTFVLRNSGGAPASLVGLQLLRGDGTPDATGELSISAPFTTPLTIREGGEVGPVSVVYEPKDAQADEAKVIVSFDGGDRLEVPVVSTMSGTPVLAVVDSFEAARNALVNGGVPAQLSGVDFGQIAAGSEATKSFFLVNAGTGNAPLPIRSVRLQSAAADFSLVTEPAPSPGRSVLLPALSDAATEQLSVQAVEVTLRFTSASECPRHAAVEILADAPEPFVVPVLATPTTVNPVDSDGDGIPDACDPCPNDRFNDEDDDGFCADVDVCPFHSDPGQLDTDGDGIGDACDPCLQGGPLDPDGDNLCGEEDNCPDVFNPEQEDSDGDGVGDACDLCPGVFDDQTDFDGDGIGDACDPCVQGGPDDPDGDGVCGAVDNCPDVANPDQEDADDDGIGDACDPCLTGGPDDPDGDGICGEEDNCPDVANPNQTDSDGNGIGDACEPCEQGGPKDPDGDGLCDDNCPDVANPGQEDADGDGIGDACDPCTRGGADDPDGDGICGGQDNCPDVANPGQEDADDDGIGDACDPCLTGGATDPDGDGICGAADNCPNDANPGQEDTDEDGIGDACDPCTRGGPDDPDGDGICGEEDNCPNDANPDQSDEDSDGLGDACDPCPGNVLNDADGDGVCDEDPTPPPTPDPGVYSWEAMPVGGLKQLQAVAYHSSGQFFVAAERNNVVRVIDSNFRCSGPTCTGEQRSFNLDPPGSPTLTFEQLTTGKGGQFMLLTGYESSSNSVTGVVYRIDPAALADPEASTEDVFTRIVSLPGERVAAVRYPWDGGNPWVLSSKKNDPGSTYVVYLRQLDPVSGTLIPPAVARGITRGYCTDLAWANNEYGQPGVFVVCDTLQLYYTWIGGVGEWRDGQQLGNWNLGNTASVAAHRFGDYVLVVNWSGGAVYRFKDGLLNGYTDAIRPGGHDITHVRFQQQGQRALIFGGVGGNPLVGRMFEYRHDLYSKAGMTDVSIPNFKTMFAADSSWRVHDVAFRPGCDGGVAVGGINSVVGGNRGFIAQFQIDNGRPCP